MEQETKLALEFSSSEKLVEIFTKYPKTVFQAMRDAEYQTPSSPTRKTQNILVCTDHANWHTGHYNAVCSMTEQLNELGYTAMLCLCKKPPEKHQPAGVKICINPVIGTTGEGFRRRIENYRKIIEENSIDTVILNSWQGSYKYWDMLILQNMFPEEPRKRVNVLLHFHSSFAKPQFELGSNWLRLNTEAIKHFDGLLVNNEVDAVFWRTYNTRVFYRPLPVKDIPCNGTQNLSKTDTVIYIARYSNTKNQLAAINAFHYVVQELPDAKLILAGDDHDGYQEKCRERVKDLDLHNNIDILNYVDGDEKDYLFNSARCAINTSRFEGFSYYLCEAKAYGLPIVAYSLPNLTVLDGAEANGAIISPKDNPAKLGQQIVRLLKDPELQEKLGNASRAHFDMLASFDYHAFWSNLFDALCSEKPPLEEWTVQQKIYASIFDALLTASHERGKKKGLLAATKRMYRKGPKQVKRAFRQLREIAYKITH